MKLDINTFNRLSLGIIEKENCSPQMAIQKLESLSLNLICGEELKNSLPLQAALLTAINTGKRAFLGGVFIKMPENIDCLLKWPGKKHLNEIVVEIGGKIIKDPNPKNFSLFLGSAESVGDNQMKLVCNDWQAGVLVDGEKTGIISTGEIPTAGIFVGGLSVFLAFLKMSGINIACCDHSIGISLWRPDLHWLDDIAKGPKISFLPAKYWLLGLGHLGQAYLWNIGLLPYNNTKDVAILLQDDDKVVEANFSAGLLSESHHKNLFKTRLCSKWLESRGFKTALIERRFDMNTKRVENEPFLALCGFDSGFSRMPLENAGFDIIVESGLGNSLSTFDIIALHTFPNSSKTPIELWGDVDPTKLDINETIYNILRKSSDEECGIIPLSISGKSVSASFVGACAGALVIAETLRGLHGGMRYDKLNLQLRDLANRKSIFHQKGAYLLEHSRNGFVSFDNLPGTF